MDKQFDHQTCSELLPGFLSGALSAPDTEAVEEHLETCEECRAEKRGLEFLTAEPDRPLTPIERSTLERGVMAGISEETGERPVIPLPQRKPVGQRVAQVLGAAATIAVLATLVYLGTVGGRGEGAGEAGSDGSETAALEEQDSSRTADRAGRNSSAKSGGGGSAGEDSLESAAADASAGSGAAGFQTPRPTFEVDADPYTATELQKRGESSLASVTFANSYSAEDTGARHELLEQLVDEARRKAGDEVAAQVERCGTQVLDTDDPTIPTFGSIGRLDGHDVLVLGFAWTRSSSDLLDRYMVWAWEQGSCEVAVDFIEGRIETAD